MSHSLSKVWIHAVWSTKARQHLINADIESRIYRVISDEFTLAKCNLTIVNGMSDHIHCLFQLEANQSLSSVVRQVKGGSSHTINQSDWMPDKFTWQTGYSAFSVSESMYWRVFNYIKLQKKHHQHSSSINELTGLLMAHGLEVESEQDSSD